MTRTRRYRRAIGLALIGLWSDLGSAATFRPQQDDQILETLAATSTPVEPKATRELFKRLAADPKNLGLATELAHLYLEQGRSTADPRFYGHAQAALQPWWGEARPPDAVLVLRASINQFNHQFKPALDDLALHLTQQPGDVPARLMQATIFQVTGDYQKAVTACRALPPRIDPLIGFICTSSVVGMQGEAASAYARLKGMMTVMPPADQKVAVWGLGVLAELAARLDRLDDAAAHFTKALNDDPGNKYLLISYADFLLDRGEAGKVIPLLASHTDNDNMLLRLAIAEKLAGAPQAEAHGRTLGERFDAERQRGTPTHQREEAMYLLRLRGDGAGALTLALSNWEAQREPIDARLVLEAAVAAKDAAAAQPVLATLAASKLEDPVLARLRLALQGEGGQ